MCAEMTSKVGVAQKFRARSYSLVNQTVFPDCACRARMRNRKHPPTVNPGSAPDECEDFDNLHLAFRLPQSCIRNVVFFEEKSLLEAHCSLSCSSERKREIHDYEQN